MMSQFLDQDHKVVLRLSRGKTKTANYREIVIDVLKEVSPVGLTKDELQKRSHIKRCKFIIILKHLIELGTVERLGTGTRADPFKYRLRKNAPVLPNELPVS